MTRPDLTASCPCPTHTALAEARQTIEDLKVALDGRDATRRFLQDQLDEAAERFGRIRRALAAFDEDDGNTDGFYAATMRFASVVTDTLAEVPGD